MAVYVDNTSGVTQYAKDTVYAVGDRVVPAKADTGTNHAVAKKYVWEVTDIGSAPNKTHATDYPSWDASYTPDVSTEVSGDITFTCRNPGYSSGSTVDWTFSTIYLEYAVNYAATAAGTIIYVAHDHSESLTADTTYTPLADIEIICVNSGTGALATTGVIGAQSTNYNLRLSGTSKGYVYGLTLSPGTGSSEKYVSIANADGCHWELESCTYLMGSGANHGLTCGVSLAAGNTYSSHKNCTIKFGNASQKIIFYGQEHEFVNFTIDAAGTAPTLLIGSYGNSGCIARFSGSDLSKVTGTLVGNSGAQGNFAAYFTNCKLGLNVTMLTTPATIVNKGNTQVWTFNCALDNDDSSYDEHFHLYHGDAFGETYVTEDTYCNDGAQYDGTNRVSWQIITRASNCSYYTPYTSPWIDVYHNGTSEIAPYLEILRSGSTTKYQDDEVWSEWSYQGTSGSTKATIVNDRMTPLGSAVDQTASSLGAGDWTGEDGANNAFMKLESGNITPQEIGHLRARVVVGEPNITVYVDPYIRGLT